MDKAHVVFVENENYDVEERSFNFKFDKVTGQYFE